MKKISLLIAEDHNLVRQGLVNILKENDWIDLIFEAETGEELVSGYSANKPDIVLTDIKMPLIDGLSAAEKILKKDADAKILFLSMFSSKQYAYEINQLGGKGLLPKNINKEELSLALKTVVEGGKYFSGFSEEDLIKLEGVSNSDQSGIDITIKRKLSKRELEILNLIAEGCSSDEIAEKLFIGRRTVDSHRRSIMDKLNIDSAPKLIKVAVENRDIERDD